MLDAAKHSPFKGLIPYSEVDSSFFFGRDSDRDSIIDNLRISRLTILYGESGVGKSSVLRAGVAHQLRQTTVQTLKKYKRPKSIVVIFPPDPPQTKQVNAASFLSWQESDPLNALKQQIAKDMKKALPKMIPPASDLSFVETLRAWTEGFDGQPGCGDLLVILDQFEEYFLYHPEETGSETFFTEFPKAVNQTNLRVNFLISIRADYLAKLDRFKGKIPNLFDNFVRLDHLNRKAAADAIVKPIREAYNQQVPAEAKFEIEEELVNVVLDQVSQILPKGNGIGGGERLKIVHGKETEAPYLQMVMTVLWQKEQQQQSHCLRLKTLKKLGGADAIVDQYLNAKMDVLDQDDQYAASVIFQHLVTPYGTKIAYPVLELEKLTELNRAELQSLLKQLDDQRIVRSTRASDEQPRYEIFHDRLVKPVLKWLKDWEIDQERQQRTRIVKQGLPNLALRQQRRNQDAIAALLARQAFCFEQREHLQILGPVTHALWKILSAPYFSNVVQCDYAMWSLAVLDAQTFVAGGADGALYGWALPCQNPTIIRKHKGIIHAITLSSDHRLLVSGGEDQTIRLWDLSSDEKSRITYRGKVGHHAKAVTCLALSPDGELLASGSEDQTILLWKVAHPHAKPTVLGTHHGTVRSIVFSPDGQTIASGGDDHLIKLWNLERQSCIELDQHQDIVRSLVFNAEGQWLASCSDDRTILLWDVSQSEPLLIDRFIGHKERIRAITFDPNHPILASASDDQTIRLWDLRDPKTEPQILRGHYFDICSLAFSPDSRRLISTSGDNTIRLWDMGDPVVVAQIPEGHDQKVLTVAFSPDGKLLASGGLDKTVRVWKLMDHTAAEFSLFKEAPEEDWQRVTSVSFSPDGQFLAAGNGDRKIRIWDLYNPTIAPRILTGHDDVVTSVAFSPIEPLLASGSLDKTVRLWQLDSPNSTAQILPGHLQEVTSVAFSHDGRQLASGSNDCTIRVWCIDQLENDPHILQDHQGRIWSVAFSVDGLLASASDDWTVRVWNLQQPHSARASAEIVLLGHSSWVSSVAFSPDGKILASSSYDRSIRLWNITRLDWKTKQLNEEPILLEGHDQSVISVAFNADGKTLASGSYDASVKLWMTSTQDLADQVCQKVLQNLTLEEWQQFMGNDIPYEPTCPNLGVLRTHPTTHDELMALQGRYYCLYQQQDAQL